ncbi:MAG: Smr/MutS family protein [Pseudomonadota bacterium]
MRPPKRHRPLGPEEQKLWAHVTKTVTPLAGVELTPDPTPAKTPLFPPQKGGKDQPPPPSLRALKMSSAAPKHRSAREQTPLKFGSGDPRQAKRVSRGHMAIDATLDLHGLTQAQAKNRLFHFIEFAKMRKHRTLLIITGKGSSEKAVPFAKAPRGILRVRFLEWIEGPPLSQMIASVQNAHQRHGGRGAFYVFLKKDP